MSNDWDKVPPDKMQCEYCEQQVSRGNLRRHEARNHPLEADLVDEERLQDAVESADYLVEVQKELGQSRRRTEWLLDEAELWDQLETPQKIKSPQHLIDVMQQTDGLESE